MNSTCKELKYACTCTVMENHHALQFNYYTTGTCTFSLLYLYCTTNVHLKYSTLHCTACIHLHVHVHVHMCGGYWQF